MSSHKFLCFDEPNTNQHDIKAITFPMTFPRFCFTLPGEGTVKSRLWTSEESSIASWDTGFPRFRFLKRRFALFEFFPIQQNGLTTMNRSFRLEEQSSPFPRDSSFEPSFEGSAATQFRYPSVEVEPRSEGYDEYFDPPLESKYECPICLLGLREPVQTSCGHRFCRGCIVRSIR